MGEYISTIFDSNFYIAVITFTGLFLVPFLIGFGVTEITSLFYKLKS